jgi:aspartyl-tRNA(Asn)/glutamyl-tRNA(Gln) amidotransferase subunit A
VTDRTRQLFRELYARLKDYRPSSQDVPPAFVATRQAAGRPGAPARVHRQTPPARKTLTLSEALERQARGELSAVDLVRQCLEKVERLDGSLNAFVTVTAEAALGRAADLDRRRAEGSPLGRLHGIPIAVKDLIHVEGVPTTASSKVLAGSVAKADATATSRLKAAGAVIIGKTQTHEFGLGVSTPQSRNPWDPERLAGGSSGGSAIAVATGMALGSINTDTRASIRVPSALCGLVGLKATFGLVPKSGVVPLGWTMDHIGPITRSVEDAARILSVIAGFDPADPFSIGGEAVDYTAFLGGETRGLRVGIPVEFLTGVDGEVARAFAGALDALRSLGVSVSEVRTPSADAIALCSAAGLVVSRSEAAAYHQPTLGTPSLYTPDVFAQLDEAGSIRAVDYVQALRYRWEFIAEVQGLFRSLDLLAMPTVPVPAPRAGDAEAVMVLLARNAIPWSFGGFPTLNLPCGLGAGRLPVSLEFVAPHFEEARLFTLAAAYDRLAPFELPDF